MNTNSAVGAGQLARAIRSQHSPILNALQFGLGRVATLSFLVAALLALPAWAQQTASGALPPTYHGSPQRQIDASSIPAAAQALISGVLGRDNRAYQSHSRTGGFRMDNPRHGVSAEFKPEGPTFQAGASHWGMALAGYGYGDQLLSATPRMPYATANRVEYRRGTLTEWYVNGPLGVEQGFTISHAPGNSKGEPLVLALSISGNLTASVDPGRRGLTLRNSGAAALRYTGLTATDAHGHELQAWLEVAGNRLQVYVDDRHAEYPLEIDPFVQEAELTSSDGKQADAIGESIAIDGDTVVLGASGSNSNQGAAYVFVKPSGGWSGSLHESAKLTASDGATGDYFGSVAISGDTIVVGAPGAKINDTTLQGAAYVFLKPGGGWSGSLNESAKLTASDGRNGDHFGGTVGIGSDTIVIGKAQDYCCNPQLAEAYVFVKPSGGWSGNLQEQARLSNSQDQDDYQFVVVGISGDGNTIVAGFYSIILEAGFYLNVFVKPDGGWSGALTPSATLTHSDGARPGAFAVNSDGGLIVVGTPFGPASATAKAAYVFLEPSGGWSGAVTESAKLSESDGITDQQFASSVAISGDTIVIGADVVFSEQTDCNCALNGAYIFVKPASGWTGSLTENQKVTITNAINLDYGNAVATNGDTILVGAPEGGNAQQGAVFAYGKVAGDFSLSDMAGITLPTDGSVTATVTVNSLTDYLGDFSEPVALTVTGQPTGVTASLNPTSVTPPAKGSANSTLTVQAGPSVTPQTFTLTLQGSYGNLTHSKTVGVTINATPGGVTQVIGTVQALGCIDNSGVSNALTTKLAQAQALINAGDIQSAINTLNALLNQLYAQAGKHIKTTCTDANGNTFDPTQVLIADVQALLASLGANVIKPNPIMGSALNSSGVGVAGATVSILNSAKNIVTYSTTDATGFYYFAKTSVFVIGSTYTIKVSPPKPYKSATSPTFTWQANSVVANPLLN